MLMSLFKDDLTRSVEVDLASTIRTSLPTLREALSHKLKEIKPEAMLKAGGSHESKALAMDFDMNTPMGRMMAAKAHKVTS
eukprot:SAG11_NODE_6414_length_1319_cov_0.887705_2_plen_81_part_00